MNIFPISNYEKLYEVLKPLSDSTYYVDGISFFKLRKIYVPGIVHLLQYQADTIVYLALTENNLAIALQPDYVVNNKNLLFNDFSTTAYYLSVLKNSTLQDIQITAYTKYLPITIYTQRDTALYNFYSEIFNSYSPNYFSFVMSMEKSPLSTGGFLWTYHHDYSIRKIVGIFDDHKTQSQFILLQDSLNNLITLNSNGEKMWTYRLPGIVKSKVFNVDIFKNHKHQILFNTSNAIYLIDRNGKDVGRFPLKFTSDITTPINVFDYDNKKNYRIWFSTENHYTYNYTLDGKIAEQYRPYYWQEVIQEPIYYTSVGLSDYMILITTKGKIVAISRKGDGRWVLSNTLPKSIYDYCFDIGNTLQDSYIYYCMNNALKRISFSDQLKDVVSFNTKVTNAQFVYNTFNHSKSLVVLFPQKLVLYSLKGDVLYNYSLDTTYKNLHIQFIGTNTYFILSNDSYHTIIQQDIDKNFNLVLRNVYSTLLPIITNIFNNQIDYIIYANNERVFCKKINP